MIILILFFTGLVNCINLNGNFRLCEDEENCVIINKVFLASNTDPVCYEDPAAYFWHGEHFQRKFLLENRTLVENSKRIACNTTSNKIFYWMKIDF
jgi:hypothetical protein